MNALQIAQRAAATINELARDADGADPAFSPTSKRGRAMFEEFQQNAAVMNAFSLLAIAESLRDLVDAAKRQEHTQ